MTFPVFASGDTLNASDMNAVGLWLVNTTNFSAVSSQTVSSVFTSDYRNYVLVLNYTTVTTQHVSSIQFTVSGTATTTNYKARTARWYAASLGWELTDDELGTDEIPVCVVSATVPTWAGKQINVYAPQIAQPTALSSFGPGSFSTSNFYWEHINGVHNASTQFDGFKLTFNGNTTGTIKTFGVR